MLYKSSVRARKEQDKSSDMAYYFTPQVFNQIAISYQSYRWQLLLWSILGLALYVLLLEQSKNNTPDILIWLNISIVLASIQALVLSAFIFFFQSLPSQSTNEIFWQKLYWIVEWSEAILFTILLPFPSLIFIFALVS